MSQSTKYWAGCRAQVTVVPGARHPLILLEKRGVKEEACQVRRGRGAAVEWKTSLGLYERGGKHSVATCPPCPSVTTTRGRASLASLTTLSLPGRLGVSSPGRRGIGALCITGRLGNTCTACRGCWCAPFTTVCGGWWWAVSSTACTTSSGGGGGCCDQSRREDPRK